MQQRERVEQTEKKTRECVCVYVIPFFLINLTASTRTVLPGCGPGLPLRVQRCATLKQGNANVAKAVMLIFSSLIAEEESHVCRLAACHCDL